MPRAAKMMAAFCSLLTMVNAIVCACLLAFQDGEPSTVQAFYGSVSVTAALFTFAVVIDSVGVSHSGKQSS